MARQLSDSLILPFNVSDYANIINDLSVSLLDRFEDLMKLHGVKTGAVTIEKKMSLNDIKFNTMIKSTQRHCRLNRKALKRISGVLYKLPKVSYS